MRTLFIAALVAAITMAGISAPSAQARSACQITERAYTISSSDDPSIYGALTVKNNTKVWQYAEVDYRVSDPRGRSLFASGTTTGAIPPKQQRTIVYDANLGPLYDGSQKVTLTRKCSKVTDKVGLVSGEANYEADEYGFGKTTIIFDNQTRYPVSDWSKIHIAVRDATGRLVSGCWGFPDQVIPPGMQAADSGVYCSDDSLRPPDYRLVATVASTTQ